MADRIKTSKNGNKRIIVEHENGYSGCLYGKSSMSIYFEGKEVLHTGFRNINTAKKLYKQLGEMPKFMEMLKNISEEDFKENDI